MSIENPNLITHVPTQEALTNQVNENAINFNDPGQLASFNEALVANGHAPRETPKDFIFTPIVSESPVQAHEGPYIEPASERTLNPAKARELRQQAAAQRIGHSLITHE